MNKLNVENIATLLEDRSVEHPDTIAYKFIGYNSNDEIIEGNLYKLPFAYCLTSYSVPNSKLTRGVSANTFHH